MGKLRSESVENKLETLLQELGKRAWKGPLNQSDISAILKCGRRVANAVTNAAQTQGLLSTHAYGFVLSSRGQNKVNESLRGRDRGGNRPRSALNFFSAGNANLEMQPGNDTCNSRFDLETADTTQEAKPGNADRVIPGSNSRFSETNFFVDERLMRSVGVEHSEHELHGASHRSPSSQSDQGDHFKHRDPSITRARARSKSRAKKTSKLAEKKARALAAIKAKKQGDPEHAKALAMARAFEAQVQVYKHQPHLKLFQTLSTQMRSKMLAACRIADAAGVDYETYVKAQFYCFDKWFSRCPKPHEISTEKSKERLQIYTADVNQGAVPADRETVGREMPLPVIPREVKDAQAERTLRTMMRQWGATEEEILRQFATGPTKYSYFDRDWLSRNTTYQQLKAAGEV